jgi:capsular exopolysaccharide synthesis family protein
LPIIGYIADVKKSKNKEEIMVTQEDHSPVAESFRSLKNNLEFLGVGKLAKTIIVTSPEQSEGKTTISTNLAVTFAQDGKRVLLIDADLRQPAVHSYFHMSNQTGLVDVLSNGLDAEAAGRAWKKTLMLNVIPSGLITPEAIKLLGSEKMDQILASLKNAYDVIVLDTPPCFVSDVQAMANKVDAIMLVVRPGYTHRDSAQDAIEQFNLVGAKIAGIIMNRIRRGSGEHYDRYRYYAPKTKSAIRQSRRRKIRALFGKFVANSRSGRKPAEKPKPPENLPKT